jgi:hypothetical protein
MAHQDLNGAEISTRLEQMSSEAMPKHVGMGTNLDSGSLGGVLARMPNGFRIDRPIRAVVVVARKEPDPGSLPYAVPMLTKLLEQLETKHHVPVPASLAAFDVNDHALAVDVAELQACRLGVPGSGGIERHQQSAMEGSGGRIDELSNFFLTEDRWQTMGPFWIRSVCDAPIPSESLGVEEPQGRQTDPNCARRQLPFLEQLGLILTNVLRAQAVRGTLESSSKILDGVHVTAYSFVRVIATLEFLQHQFA